MLDHVLRGGHLRHAIGADEADRLDARQSRRGQAVDELGPNGGLQNLRLVLKPVAGADVAEDERQLLV